MTWLTWRLHRLEAVLGLILFAGLIAIMVPAAGSVDSAYEAARDAGCFGNSTSESCGGLFGDYSSLVSRWSNLTPLLHGVPLVVAALLAIPLLQELERGTHRLAWTQSVSRRRWSISRGAFAIAVALLVSAVWALVAADWRRAVLREDPRSFGQEAFDLSPAVLIGYGVFCVALGVAAAVVVRRVIPALALMAAGFIGLRVLTAFVLRERYMSPVEETAPAVGDIGPFTASDGRWVVDESWLSRTGERLSWESVNRLCIPATVKENIANAYDQCLVDNGLQYFRAYHPADRFAEFQAIETAIYVALAAALLGFAYWWLTRRPA